MSVYRPQFAYKTPDGCRDEEFTYFFDGSNTPLLYTDISGKTINNIPLVMERDAPFYWRGIKVAAQSSASGPNGSVGGITGYDIPNVSLQFQDCYQNNLSDGLIPATNYAFPMNPVAYQNGLYTGAPFLLDCTSQDPEWGTGDGIYCPAGGYILLFLKAPTLAGPTLLNVTLYGFKRFKDCRK